MTYRNEILSKIWWKNIKEWDKIYGKLTESLRTHYGHNGATEILINANGRKIDIIIVGPRMPYKFEDEADDMYRGSIEDISIEDLEKMLGE